MKKQYFKYVFAALVLLLASSCEINEITDPNNPNRSSIESNASIGELNNLVAGTESLMRKELGFYYDVVGIIGREHYFFTDADPRYTGELLGKEGASLDAAGFYGTRPYAGRYAAILNANILINAVNNTSAVLTAEEKNGYLGFAKTAQAYSYLLALNLQYDNGIRIDVADPENLGPFVGYQEALTAISALLDEAHTHLTSAGTEFKFSLSSGFAGFDTPATFAQFNRAIKARVEIYRGNKANALTALAASFMSLAGNLDNGPSHSYSTAGNDVANPVYRVPGEAEALIAHPSFIADARPGDTRLAEKTETRTVATSDGLSGTYDVTLYESLDSDIKIIRNEELILLYAEANIGTNNTAAVNALDVVRNAAGLGNYAGATDNASLEAELLYNRRYSLFGEGHRWIDLRRYNLLNTLPIDRVGDDVWMKFPRPVSEVGVQGG
jgi:starch-binding outer membrane protein, SusD/RagB family